jgi:hypothetical protein
MEAKDELRKQKMLEYNKNYRERNRDKIYEKNKTFRENHPEKFREYYQKNKDSIKEKRKELVHCPACNYEVTRESFYRHKLSQTHQENEQRENWAEWGKIAQKIESTTIDFFNIPI